MSLGGILSWWWQRYECVVTLQTPVVTSNCCACCGRVFEALGSETNCHTCWEAIVVQRDLNLIHMFSVVTNVITNVEVFWPFWANSFLLWFKKIYMMGQHSALVKEVSDQWTALTNERPKRGKQYICSEKIMLQYLIKYCRFFTTTKKDAFVLRTDFGKSCGEIKL